MPKAKPLEDMTEDELEALLASLESEHEALRGRRREAKRALTLAMERRDAADASERRLQTATASTAVLDMRGA